MYIDTYIHTYIHTYIDTYTYIHTYIHTHVASFSRLRILIIFQMYTYIHVYIYIQHELQLSFSCIHTSASHPDHQLLHAHVTLKVIA
jgi:hypothetical protein